MLHWIIRPKPPEGIGEEPIAYLSYYTRPQCIPAPMFNASIHHWNMMENKEKHNRYLHYILCCLKWHKLGIVHIVFEPYTEDAAMDKQNFLPVLSALVLT